MALSPQRIRETTFRSARKGYDQGEVDAFVQEVAVALESAQNDATAMEARARAAVARLQELSHGQPGEAAAAEPPVRVNVDESETISRTLLLAQRTADQTVADARAEAEQVLQSARQDASSRMDDVRLESDRMIDEAKAEARRARESERVRVEGEVQALLARRDFLESDVEHLEQYVHAQRDRLMETAAELNALAERVPGGLGEMRRPLLSAAAAAEQPRPTEELPLEHGAAEQDGSEISEITRIAEGNSDSASDDAELPPPDRDDAEPAQRTPG